MPIKKKTDLDGLASLSAEDRADLAGLFDGLEERNAQIATLRGQAADADQVVKRNKDLEKLLGEKEKLSTELQEKLNKLTVKAPVSTDSNFDDLGPFAEIRKFLESFFEEDPGTQE